MKKSLLIIFQFGFIILTSAQTLRFSPLPKNAERSIDSLRPLLVQIKNDTGKVDLLNLLADAYYNSRLRDSAIWYAQQALDLARKINYTHGHLTAREQMAVCLRQSGRYPEALQLLLVNLEINKQQKDTLRVIRTNSLLAFTCWAMNDFSKMLEYASENGRLVHSGYFKTENEVKHYSLGYMNWIAEAFEGLDQLDSSSNYFHQCYTDALSLKDTQAVANAMRGLGSVLTKQGRAEEAFFYFHAALKFAEPGGNLNVIPHSYLGLAKLFDQNKQIDSALYYCRLALNIFQLLRYPAQELKAASFMTDLFAKQNRTDSAYKYLTLTTTLKDSLFNQEKTRQVQSLQFNEILRLRKLAEQRREAQQKYATRVKLYSLIGGMAVAILVAFLLHRNNRQKQKTNLLLLQEKEKVEAALSELKSTQAQLIQSEKMASLGELTAGIAHEIQNPLNFVNNFSEVNKEMVAELKEEIDKGNYDEAKQIANDIEENSEKINRHGKRADAIVKGMLQHSKTSSGQKELIDINALCDEYLRLAYHGFRARDKAFNAKFETDLDSSIEKMNIVPQDIGRLLLNLINNAFYAVNEKAKLQAASYDPIVIVTTRKLNNKVEIKVKDNGSGIPDSIKEKIFQPFFTTKPTGQGTGLGLSLAYDIVKAHGGEINVETKENVGSVFVIQLPMISGMP